MFEICLGGIWLIPPQLHLQHFTVALAQFFHNRSSMHKNVKMQIVNTKSHAQPSQHRRLI